MGQFEEAISDFTEAVKLKPKHFDFYYSRGLAYNKLGQYDEAISDFTEAIKLKSIAADTHH